MSTMNLFTAIELRDRGMELAEQSRSVLVAKLRTRLEVIAASRTDRTASADDVSELLEDMGLNNSDLGNAAGSVFTYGNKWEIVDYHQSRRKSNHARRIAIWKLKEGRS